MSLPDHTRRLVERQLRGYCARICPPSFERQVLLGYRIERERVTVHELRPIYASLGMDALRELPLAQFRHGLRDGRWRLYFRDGPGRWRRYRRLPAARDFAVLLREFDADPHGIFWDRLDGKSLRWCSARGRCSGCTARYAEILGLSAVESVAQRDTLGHVAEDPWQAAQVVVLHGIEPQPRA